MLTGLLGISAGKDWESENQLIYVDRRFIFDFLFGALFVQLAHLIFLYNLLLLRKLYSSTNWTTKIENKIYIKKYRNILILFFNLYIYKLHIPIFYDNLLLLL